jgi:hypothetical protein
MNKKKITQFLQSFVAIPMIAVTASTSGVSPLPSPTVLLSQNNAVEASPITTEEEKIRKERAEDIDKLLASYDSPLVGYGEKFVIEAEKNDIDWRLLPAIAGVESTFGRHACKKAKNSFLGYGSCKMDFKSVDDAIERVSASLGGNNENTAHHYEGKNTAQILRKYNSVIPDYPSKVIRIMKMINKEEDIV